MKYYQFIACLTLASGNLLFADHHEGDADLAKQLDQLIEAISVTDEAQRYEPRMAMQALTSQASAPGSTSRDAWVTLLVDRFAKEETSQAAKAWILRQLENIGGAESVPALVQTMGSPFHQLRDLARRALEKNSSPDASAALRDLASKEADAGAKRALVHSLGERRDADSVAMLGEWLGAADSALTRDVIRALGAIASEDAVQALSAKYQQSDDVLKTALADALFEAARHAGRGERAEKILRDLYGYDQPASIRASALRGLVAQQPADLEDLIILSFQSKDTAVRQAAIGACRGVESKSIVSNVLAYKVAELAEPEQFMALAVLGDLGDTTVSPSIAEIVAKQDVAEAVKLEAVRVLGQIGGADASDRVLRMLGNLEGDIQAAAREALTSMPGDGVDASLLAATGADDITVRADAISALGSRGSKQAIPVLFNYVEKGPKHIRRASLQALGALAGPDDIAKLTNYLGLDEHVVRALVAACRRTDQKAHAAKAILAVMQSQELITKAALLPCLSILGGDDGLKAVRDLLGIDELKEPAMNALTSWSGGEAAPVLIELAGSDVSEEQYVLLFRGLGRLLESDRTGLDPGARLKYALSGIETAKRPEEKKLMLAVIGKLGSIEAAERLIAMLGDSAIAEEAALAAMNVARSMGRNDRESAGKILTAIAESAASQDIKDSAKQMLERGGRRSRR